MPMKLIVAMTQNRVIGNKNQIPWHIPKEQALFKKITMGHTILMGRKTYESIGRVLPGRKNGVITRNPGFHGEGIIVYPSLDKALKVHAGESFFVIGGEEIFNQTISRADEIYLTTIHITIPGDRFFPPFDKTRYEIVEIRFFRGEPDYEWIHYRKRLK
jgi:dihydrofolate reductase